MRWAYFGLLFFTLLFVSEFANAQHKFALDVGYHYMKGSRGYLGAEYRPAPGYQRDCSVKFSRRTATVLFLPFSVSKSVMSK